METVIFETSVPNETLLPKRTSSQKVHKNFERQKKEWNIMKNNKEKKIKNKEQKKYDKGQVFVKIMAGILSLLMILSVAGSLIFSLI